MGLFQTARGLKISKWLELEQQGTSKRSRNFDNYEGDEWFHEVVDIPNQLRIRLRRGRLPAMEHMMPIDAGGSFRGSLGPLCQHTI